MRLVDPDNGNEPDNKLNKLVSNALPHLKETAANTYLAADWQAFRTSGAAQLIFSDLGTRSTSRRREGFSAYR